VFGSAAQLAGRTVVRVVRAEVWMILEGFHARCLFVIPQLFHLLHDPEEIAACQLRQLVNCPAAAKEFGK